MSYRLILESYQKFNSYIEEHVQSLLTEEQQKIESELENVEGFINVADKREEIDKRLGKIVENDSHLKEIASKLEEMAKKVVYDNPPPAPTNYDTCREKGG